jgi:hypothetical protein
VPGYSLDFHILIIDHSSISNLQRFRRRKP